MQERELKFFVPDASRGAVLQAMQGLHASELSLHACYHDTPDRQLAQLGIALRSRWEDGQWVQTVKMPGADEVSRIEISYPRPDQSLDLRLYEDTDVGSALAPYKKSLAVQFETQITRLAAIVDTPAGAIELAYDRGFIHAGGYEIPVAELEFELVSGSAVALFDLSESWVRQYGLVLDLVSKAERGVGLARVVAAGAGEGGKRPKQSQHETSQSRPLRPEMVRELAKPRRAAPVELNSAGSMMDAYRAIASECVSQIIRNLTLLATAPSSHVAPDMLAAYVHQARVGIRRLRTCWKLFDGWLPDSYAARLDELRQLFATLGKMRDPYIVQHKIEPMLLAAGMPPCEQWTGHEGSYADAVAVARSPSTQVLLLSLLGDVVKLEGVALLDDDTRPAGERLKTRIKKWLDKLIEGAADFKALSVDAQHDRRKEAKRVRYALEFSRDVLPAKRVDRVLQSLYSVQDALGDLNDFYVAEDHYRQLVAQQPSAWFAVGWLKAMQVRQQDLAQEGFKLLADAT